MSQTAAHLVDPVIPHVPVRRWVLSLPIPLRSLLAAFEQQGLRPSNPLTKALAYVRHRRPALEVFLRDPDVPMDTNHLERALRPIPLGLRNWLFCWTEGVPGTPGSCKA